MRIVLFALALVIMPATLPGANKGWQGEVAHLLGFIEKSDCIFTRNGKNYDSLQARAHIEKKFEYLKKKIDSTEQFIRYSATKSSISGVEYEVSCGGVSLTSRQWLESELKRYREEKR